MEYKGYIGKVELDEEAGILHGEVINTRDVITFQGQTVAEITQSFRDSIDDYLDFCKTRGEKPEKPYSGKFTLRLEPDLHRKIHIKANLENTSVNTWVTEVLESAVSVAEK
ncbi:MAG: type II toxin-antitoxin system HicB family antitoxin [Dehalococcoidia bacterium]|nr:type II toxin-antitoxin system HicB family antitoxin [Dehalococcoidia bacterium]